MNLGLMANQPMRIICILCSNMHGINRLISYTVSKELLDEWQTL